MVLTPTDGAEGRPARPSAEPATVLTTAADLSRFIGGGGWLASRRRIELALRHLPERRRATTERRLNFWRTVCGCVPASLAVLATLFWRGSAAIEAGQWFPAGAAIEIAYVLTAALAAKAVAVVLAKLALAAELVLLWQGARQSLRGDAR